MSNISLTGKHAIITGAGSGIGRAIAELFAESEACIHAVDFDPTRVKNTASSITSKGLNAFAYECDVSNLNSMRSVVDSINLAGSPLVLVNCAGVAHVGNVENTTEEDFDRLFRINVKGYFNCIRACISYMKNQESGVILNIASIAACVGIADRFAYSVTKGAVLAMTYSVAKDYVSYNIRCNSISPARVHTEFVDNFVHANYRGRESEIMAGLTQSQPIGRMGTPHEVAMLALFLCSDSASFITGSNYLIDGGVVSLSTR